MATQVASLIGVLELDDRQFTRGIRNSEGALRGVASSLRSVEATARRVGTQMTTYLTTPIVGALAIATKSAIDFDEAMTNAGAILGVTRDEASDLRAEIIRMGAASRAGVQPVAEAFYDIVSGVQDASTHMAILNAAILTSEAGAANLGATTSALIAVMNSYGFSAEDAAFVSDVFTRTVGMGVMTMDQLASALPSVTGMAKSMGIELDTLAGYMAYMTTQGVTASEASTLLAGAMSAMLNPTAGLQKAIEALGFDTGEAMVAALGLDGALTEIKNYGNGSFAGLITSQEALRAALILTGAGAEEFFTTFKDGIEGATDAARAIQMESVAYQFDQLKASLGAVFTVIGLLLLPVLNEFMQSIVPIIDNVLAWSMANPEAAQTLVQVALVAAAAGPVLIALATIIKAGATVVGVLTGALGLAKIALLAFTSPIGIVIALGVALGAAIYSWLDSLGVIDRLRDAITAAFGVISGVVKGVIDMILFIPRAISDAANAIAGLGETNSRVGAGYSGNAAANIAAATGTTGGGGRSAGGGEFLRDGRAGGGSVQGGMPYLVGERGPELFIPHRAGRIASNEEAETRGGLGGGETYNITIYANDRAGGAAAADAFEERIRNRRRTR